MIYLRVVATSTGRLRYSLTRSTISLRVSSVRRVKMKNHSCLRWAGLTPRVIADRTVVFVYILEMWKMLIDSNQYSVVIDYSPINLIINQIIPSNRQDKQFCSNRVAKTIRFHISSWGTWLRGGWGKLARQVAPGCVMAPRLLGSNYEIKSLDRN